MRARRSIVATLLVVLPGVLAGCAAGDEPDRPAALDAEELTATAGRVCTEIINAYDPAVVEAGRRAGLEAVVAARRSPKPDAAARERLSGALAAHRDTLRAATDRLSELASADQPDAWAEVVQAVQDRADEVDRRARAVEAEDWSSIEPSRADTVDLEPALERLGLPGRDCGRVSTAVGNALDHEVFLDAATTACSTIASRRQVGGFDTDLVLGAVQDVLEDDVVAISPDLIEQTEAVRAEWQRTTTDLESVPTADAPDARAWQDTVRAAQERVDVFGERVTALRADDQPALRRLFGRDVWKQPGLGDLVANGLDDRDCRVVQG